MIVLLSRQKQFDNQARARARFDGTPHCMKSIRPDAYGDLNAV